MILLFVGLWIGLGGGSTLMLLLLLLHVRFFVLRGFCLFVGCRGEISDELDERCGSSEAMSKVFQV